MKMNGTSLNFWYLIEVQTILEKCVVLVFSVAVATNVYRNQLGNLIFDPNHNFEVIIDIITEMIQNWSAIYPV